MIHAKHRIPSNSVQEGKYLQIIFKFLYVKTKGMAIAIICAL